jgi:uncharacterized membrane protein YgaE (UPF0421/DUF939 family)
MGIRVLKTAVAAVAAIYIAEYFNLNFALSAGLLAILGVDVTKKKSINSALHRVFASVLGLFFALLVFYLFGFQTWAVGIFICIAYPVMAKARLKDGIVTSSVIVLHVFAEGVISAPVIMNEILLLIIGLGSATAFNLLYMPRADKELLHTRVEVERLFSVIFKKIANHLKDNDYVWSGEEIIHAHEHIQNGIKLTHQSNENALFRGDAGWSIYFHMREQQMEAIQRMLDIVAQIYQTLPHGQLTAEIFLELSEDVKNDFYTGHAENRLLALEKKFKEMPLPLTREEFEVRSAILQLCVELKHYLGIARKEKKQKEQVAF